MSTILCTTAYDYHPHRKIVIQFAPGAYYINVPDLPAQKIVAAGAGSVFTGIPPTGSTVRDYKIDATMRRRAPLGKSTWHQARPARPSQVYE